MKWHKVEAGVWETEDRSYRAVSVYNGFLASSRWHLYSQVPAAERWMGDTRTLINTLPTLRECKALVK